MISDQQKKILAFPYTDYDALICDGAIRSGKTSIMFVAYVDWAMTNFNGRRFIVGGKTVSAAERNVIEPYLSMAYAHQKYSVKYRIGQHRLVVRRGGVVNFFDIFGGADSSSYMLVQGFTAAGCFLDEVALLDRMFVLQCLARCSVEGSRLWFNCNPDTPEHWFKKEWIDKLERHNALYLKFKLADNPSLSPNIIARYESMYDGVFRKRYIEGDWVVAEGLVYGEYANGELLEKCEATEKDLCFVSIDYGISNPFVALLWKVHNGVAYCCDEYSYDGRQQGKRIDEEHYKAVAELIGDRYVDSIVVDPSANSFIELIRRKGVYDVSGANNAVKDGIARTMVAMKLGCLRVSPKCKTVIQELGLYSWDPKSKEDAVIKENDHAMDAMRYFVNTIGVRVLKCFE